MPASDTTTCSASKDPLWNSKGYIGLAQGIMKGQHLDSNRLNINCTYYKHGLKGIVVHFIYIQFILNKPFCHVSVAVVLRNGWGGGEEAVGCNSQTDH